MESVAPVSNRKEMGFPATWSRTLGLAWLRGCLSLGPVSHHPIRVVERLDFPAQGFLCVEAPRIPRDPAGGFPVAHRSTLRELPRWLLGIGTSTGPLSLGAASEAGPRRGSVGSPFLRGFPLSAGSRSPPAAGLPPRLGSGVGPSAGAWPASEVQPLPLGC